MSGKCDHSKTSGSLDQLHNEALAIGMVLACSGSSRIFRSILDVGGCVCTSNGSRIFTIGRNIHYLDWIGENCFGLAVYDFGSDSELYIWDLAAATLGWSKCRRIFEWSRSPLGRADKGILR